jgi:hypothetical protein
MTVSSAALPTYERLRTEVLNGSIRPDGLTAIAYHGMFRGLSVILAESATSVPPSPAAAPPANDAPLDRDLLRLIVNMVLQTQSQVMHVY